MVLSCSLFVRERACATLRDSKGARMTLSAELERLSELNKSGVLSEEEFRAAKQRLLAGDPTPSAVGQTGVSGAPTSPSPQPSSPKPRFAEDGRPFASRHMPHVVWAIAWRACYFGFIGILLLAIAVPLLGMNSGPLDPRRPQTLLLVGLGMIAGLSLLVWSARAAIGPKGLFHNDVSAGMTVGLVIASYFGSIMLMTVVGGVMGALSTSRNTGAMALLAAFTLVLLVAPGVFMLRARMKRRRLATS